MWKHNKLHSVLVLKKQFYGVRILSLEGHVFGIELWLADASLKRKHILYSRFCKAEVCLSVALINLLITEPFKNGMLPLAQGKEMS